MLMVNGNPDTRNQEHGVSSEMFQLRPTSHSLAIDGVLYPGHYITTTAVEYDLAIPNSVATHNCDEGKNGGNMNSFIVAVLPGVGILRVGRTSSVP